MFGPGHAAANPQLVAAVMAAASSDYAAQLIGSAIEHVAEALLVEEEETRGFMQPRELLRARP